MSRRRLAALAAVTLAVAAGFAAPTAAAAAPARPLTAPPGSGWQRYHTQPFTDPAGDPCSYEVDVTVVRDGEYYRTLASNPDGSPRLQEFTGPLFLRYTNATTGRAVTRDLSGTAFFYGSDGSLVAPWSGGGGVTAHPGNVGLAPGEWVFTGTFVLTEDPAGNKAVRQFSGTRENLCTMLA